MEQNEQTEERKSTRKKPASKSNMSELIVKLEALRIPKQEYQYKNNIVRNGYDCANEMLDKAIAIVRATIQA